MAKLKVIGGNFFFPGGGQVRAIAAVKSQAEMAMLAKTSVGHIRDFCAETGNQAEIRAAMRQPGVLLWFIDREYAPESEAKEFLCRNLN